MTRVPTTATAPSTSPSTTHAPAAVDEVQVPIASPVAVLIGACSGALTSGRPTEVWPTTDMLPRYGFEAIYDPARISLADAEAAVRTELAQQGVHVARILNEDNTWASDVEDTRRRMLAQWDAFRQEWRDNGTATPAVEQFTNEVALLISASPDPQATMDQIVDVLSRERVKRRACRVYTWCDATGPHYDHARHETGIVRYGAVHLSEGEPALYVGEAEFPPEQAAVKAAELRAIADRIEAMATATQKASPR